MNKMFLLIVFMLIFSFRLLAKPNYGDITISKIQINDIHDGDTFYMDFIGAPDVIGDNIGVRISGIDCPELNSKSEFLRNKAIQARQFLIDQFIISRNITLKDTTRDKYSGRIGAYVLIDGNDITKMLLEKKLGYEYYGGKKKTEQEQEEILI